MERPPTFEEELEAFLHELNDRERQPEFGSERLAEIREWVERKQPFEHPERYIAKDIHGLEEFKRVIALSVISPARPIHTVAVGDPAVGKSQIAQAFQHITPNTVYCLGSKLTAAGLTLARLGRKLMVGVLPRCHYGCAMIDEFNLCTPVDAAAVLSVMQDGYFSVEKAYLKVEYVPAKTSIVAMANPKGDYWISSNPDQIRRQMPFRSKALLTRFHLIFVILRPTVEEFGEISEHQLKYRMGKEACAFSEKEKGMWADAVVYLRHFTPSWTGSGFKRRLIAAFTRETYRQERRGGIAIPISPRLNEGITNLAEAYAKVRFRDEVYVRDVMKAIALVANSLVPCGLDLEKVRKVLAEVLRSA